MSIIHKISLSSLIVAHNQVAYHMEEKNKKRPKMEPSPEALKYANFSKFIKK